MSHGAPHWHGLGSCELVSLAEARDKAIACRKLLLGGSDPIKHERDQKMQVLLAATSTVTFEEAAKRYITAHAPSWRNPKHAAQWPATLAAYA